jgi:hypothetical protein
MSDFAIQFGAGALATLVGVVIGIPAALYVNRMISGWQRQAERAREQQHRRQEEVSVLQGLLDELGRNEWLLKEMRDELPNGVIFYTLDTSFWEAASGRQIQCLENFELVARLSRLYYEFQHLKRKIDAQFEMHYSAARALSDYRLQREGLVGAILAQIDDRVVGLRDEVAAAVRNEIETLEALVKSHRGEEE